MKAKAHPVSLLSETFTIRNLLPQSADRFRGDCDRMREPRIGREPDLRILGTMVADFNWTRRAPKLP